MRLKGKNVLVVGLGRSGLAAVRFLLDRGARVSVVDKKASGDLGNGLDEFRSLVAESYLGSQEPKIFEKRDLICLSPGVPGDLPGLRLARRRRIPILGEMGLASGFCKTPVVAVTGTNGKSTTSTLIASLLAAGGQRVALAGNIGKPFLEIVMDGKKYHRVVLEVSSFQLETMYKFHPEVSVLLNVTEDHLDRYSSFKDYVRTKMRILRDQTRRDAVVYNQEDPYLTPYVQRAHPKKIPFSRNHPQDSGVFFSRGRIVRRWKREFEEYPLQKVSLVGDHNVENMMASIGTARHLGVPPEKIQRTLESFEGLPHRMQLVLEKGGVRYFNDSKATNVDAVMKSISGFGNGHVLLIAGGRAKGGRFSPLRDLVKNKVKTLFTIGEAAPRLARDLKDCTQIEEVGTLEAAVKAAAAKAKAGDTVLLSPACASFDQFKNFEDRGEQFQQWVKMHA